jgi:hypothetical protein
LWRPRRLVKIDQIWVVAKLAPRVKFIPTGAPAAMAYVRRGDEEFLAARPAFASDFAAFLRSSDWQHW